MGSAESHEPEPVPTQLVAAAPAAERRAEAGRVSTELQAFFHELLEAQCRLARAVAGIAYLTASASRPGGVVARYARAESGAADAAALLAGATLAQLERAAIAAVRAAPNGPARPAGIVEPLTLPDRHGLYDPRPTHRILASPLLAEGRVEGATAVVVSAADSADPDDALQRLALTNARFEAFLWRQQCLLEARQRAMLRESLELLDAAQRGEDVAAMASLLCHEIARRFGCWRVSIGMVRRGRVRVLAVSGVDESRPTGPAVDLLHDAMDECAEQDCEILFPPPKELERDPAHRRITRAHEALSRAAGPSAVLSLPLRAEGELVGVAVLERDVADPFPLGSLALVRLVGEFIGPALWTRRLADRGLLAVGRDRAAALARAVAGPRHTGKKLLVLVALVALAVLTFVPIPARVGAPAQVRPQAARAIVPPFAGYLAHVLVRPGDRVEAGQPLVEMDASDLRLRRAEAQAERASLLTQRADAQAAGDLARVGIASARIDALDHQIALLDAFIDRAVVRAPIAGTVSGSDLEALISARVEPTQLLFDIVTDQHVVVVHVDERDIHRVRTGQPGTMTVRALPGEPVPLVVSRINPVARAVEGHNVYLVEAEVRDAPGWLRPGMTGTARLDAGTTTGLQRLVGPLVDELRMRFWW